MASLIILACKGSVQMQLYQPTVLEKLFSWEIGKRLGSLEFSALSDQLHISTLLPQPVTILTIFAIQAIDLILEPRDGPEHKMAALNEWKTSKNAEAALKKLEGKSNCLEGLLLEGLAKQRCNDFVNALSMVCCVTFMF